MMKTDDEPRTREERLYTLKLRQALDLESKVLLTAKRIEQWLVRWNGLVYVARSGGLGSTVLDDIAKQVDPSIPSVFNDTGMEFSEVRENALAGKNLIINRPKLDFRSVLTKYGVPVISKRVAQYVHEVQASRGETATKRLRLTGITGTGKMSRYGMIPKRWQCLCAAPFKVSDQCCKAMKKRPAHAYETATGRMPILGIMTGESQQRELTYLGHGCNAYDLTRPVSWPMAFWTQADVWAYIRSRKLAYPSVYDMGYTQTGCVFCLFGIHMQRPENKMQMLYRTHPRLHRYCMEVLGLRAVMDYIGLPCEPTTLF